MTTLIRTNEYGTILTSNYKTYQGAVDAGNSFLRDCTIHKNIRDKRKIEVIEDAKWVICDTTENYGKPYVAEDLSNTGDSDSAW